MTDTTKPVAGSITPRMIRDAAGWSQSEDDLRDTLRLAADELERALAAASVDDEKYTETCPICDELFKLGDMCATDIELGQSHAECLEGCPTVDLETGEEIEGPITNYPYEPDPASTQARSALSEAPAPETHVAGLEAQLDAVWNAAVEQAAVIANDCVHLTPDPGAAIRVMLDGRAKLHQPATTEGSDNG